MKHNNSLKNIILPLIIAVSVVAGLLIGWYLPGKKTLHSISGFTPNNDKTGNIVTLIEIGRAHV